LWVSNISRRIFWRSSAGRVRNVMGCGGVALVGTFDVFGFFEVWIGFNFLTVLEARNVLEVFTHLERISIAILEA